MTADEKYILAYKELEHNAVLEYESICEECLTDALKKMKTGDFVGYTIQTEVLDKAQRIYERIHHYGE